MERNFPKRSCITNICLSQALTPFLAPLHLISGIQNTYGRPGTLSISFFLLDVIMIYWQKVNDTCRFGHCKIQCLKTVALLMSVYKKNILTKPLFMSL